MSAVGNNEIEKVYLGAIEISKMYLGEDLVFGNSVPLPYDAQVEYLESDGNQWINTGFAPSQDDLRIIVDAFQVTSTNSIIYGMTDVSSTLKLNNVWYNGTYLYFRYRSYNTRFGISSRNRHIIETGPQMKIDDGVKATPSFTSSFVGNTNIICLFGMPNNGTNPTSISSPFKGRIYEFWIYYGTTLQMHLIPVRLNSIGYMYDTVSKEMFSNSGSGSFSYGNDV